MERWSRAGIIWVFVLWVALALAPLLLDPSNVRLLSRALIVGLFAMSLNILLGNTGIVSFGHGLFYGGGAYTVTLLWTHLGWPALLGVLMAPVVGAVFGVVSGLLAFRARRLYFGLLTLAISQFGFVIAEQWYSLTGGENGIYGVELPSWLGTPTKQYIFVFVITSASFLFIRILLASPFGATLRAIRDNRERVGFLGVRASYHEFVAYVISAALASLAGALLVILDQSSYPTLFHWTTSAEPLLMIVIGGATSFLGPLVGAGVVVFVQDYLQDVTQHINLIYGIVVLVIALGAPGGLARGGRVMLAALLDGLRRISHREKLVPASPSAGVPEVVPGRKPDTSELEPARRRLFG